MSKLGVSYNCFDDSIDLLEGSIKSVRNVVDHVSVIYQDISNMGNPADINIKDVLDDLKSKKLIDEYYIYKPQLNAPIPHLNELNKRNMGLYVAQNVGCTHFMSMDCDEYYNENQLKSFYDEIVKEDYDSSACELQTYWKTGEWVLDPPEDYWVSLIYKIRPNVDYVMGHVFPVLVDPTRRMNPGKCKLATREEIEMHHVSYVRKDFAKKLYNSSSISSFYDIIDDLITDFNNWKEGDLAYMPNRNKYKLRKVDNILK